MDSLIAAAARALSVGDVLEALKHVALRDDPSALALRGIAMAQLGEHARARELLRSAIRTFGEREVLARSRCVVAEAEVALALRDVSDQPDALAAAARALEARDDPFNATLAHLIAIRRLVLLGRIDSARSALERLHGRGMPPTLLAVAALARAEVELRSLRTAPAREALAQARTAAAQARVPALIAEVAEAASVLDRPAARMIRRDTESPLRLHEVEALFASNTLVVDACRRSVRRAGTWIPLARRPVLFTLVRALAEGWPGEIGRNALIARAFRIRRVDETHRARLRVEIGRLRALLAAIADIEATTNGFALSPHAGADVSLLAPPIDGEEASLVALLADGAAWSTSALALALGASQRTIQRALADMERSGRVRAIGQARAKRWVAPPLTGFTTILLLPATLPPA